MSKLVPALPMALSFIMASPALLAQSVTHDADDGKHPYDIALAYCDGREGLAQYSVQENVVKFSCSDNLTDIITILQ